MMKIDNEPKLDFDDVLLVPQRSRAASRKNVDITRNFRFYHSPKEWHGTPIMAANMDATGTFKMGIELSKYGLVTCLHKYYSLDEIELFFKYYNLEPYVWSSIGMGKEQDIYNLKVISEQLGCQPNICIDIANGYTENFVGWCAKIRDNFPDSIIMAGNVATPEMVSELILHGGVDIVKIGIGPGSACTTRLKTGVGYPQLSCIYECSHAAHGLRSDVGRLGLVCADGGCRTPGDVSKAFAAGADFVMLGGMLAGTEECEGEWTYEEPPIRGDFDEKKKSLTFYGMSSKKAQEKHSGGMESYKSSEGRVKTVEYKGKVSTVIEDICGGIRSSCAYTGATCLKDFSKTAKFVKVNRTHYDQSV